MLDVDKSLIDNLGRWNPSGSSTYVRTYRQAVVKMQLKAVAAYHGGAGKTILREGDIADAMYKYLVERREVFEDDATKVVQGWSRRAAKFHSCWDGGAPSFMVRPIRFRVRSTSTT